jgi:LysM repeat protein
MKSVQQLLLGLIAAIGTSLLVLGAFSMALAEDEVRVAEVLNTVTVLPSPSATGPTSAVPAVTLTPSATLPPVQPTSCPTPAGWVPYVIQSGDTLEGLADRVGLTAAEIRKANCLSGITLIPNAILHLPVAGATLTASPVPPTMLPTLVPTLPPTVTPVPCGPPPGWVPYIVRRGDTLFRLSLAYGVSQDMLRISNCMAGTGLIAGQILYVPNVIPRTPVVPSTSVPPTATSVPPTATSVPPSATQVTSTATDPSPTNTSMPTVTNTVVPTSTWTSTSIPTSTSEPTVTTAPTAAATEGTPATIIELNR